MNLLDRGLQEAWRMGNDTIAAEDGVDEKSGRLDSCRTHFVDAGPHPSAKPRRTLRGERGLYGEYVGSELDAGDRRHSGERLRRTVIGCFRDDESGPTGGRLADSHREIIRFAARARKRHRGELARHGCEKPF